MRWNEALDGYWLSKRRSMSEHTVSDYSITFRRFGIYIKYGEVERITSKQVNAFLTHIADEYELSAKTIQNAWIALSSFWTWGHDELGLPHIIRNGVEMPSAKSPPPLPYTEDEVRALLKACESMNAWSPKTQRHVEGTRQTKLRDIAIMLVLLDTGMRVSELCALKVSDYDRKQGRLIIRHGKGDKPRVVYMGQAAQRALWRYLAERTETPAGAPLLATRADRRMNKDSVLGMIAHAGERAGVAGASCHRFRHTFAVNFLRNGGNILALQDLLGHSSMEMVRRYARQAEVDLAKAQKRASPADNWGL